MNMHGAAYAYESHQATYKVNTNSVSSDFPSPFLVFRYRWLWQLNHHPSQEQSDGWKTKEEIKRGGRRSETISSHPLPPLFIPHPTPPQSISLPSSPSGCDLSPAVKSQVLIVSESNIFTSVCSPAFLFIHTLCTAESTFPFLWLFLPFPPSFISRRFQKSFISLLWSAFCRQKSKSAQDKETCSRFLVNSCFVQSSLLVALHAGTGAHSAGVVNV